MESNLVKLFIETQEKKYNQVVKLAANFPCIIGRQSPNLTIKDVRISRKHCQLILEAGQLYVEDLGSSNGVEVNGFKVKRVRLRADDQIKIGDTMIKILKIELATVKRKKI